MATISSLVETIKQDISAGRNMHARDHIADAVERSRGVIDALEEVQLHLDRGKRQAAYEYVDEALARANT